MEQLYYGTLYKKNFREISKVKLGNKIIFECLPSFKEVRYVREIKSKKIFPVIWHSMEFIGFESSIAIHCSDEVRKVQELKSMDTFIGVDKFSIVLAQPEEVEAYNASIYKGFNDLMVEYAISNQYIKLPKFEQENELSFDFGKTINEISDNKLLLYEQKIEILLLQIKQIDKTAYGNFKNQLQQIFENSDEYSSQLSTGVLVLYDSQSLENRTLLELVSLETQIEFYLQEGRFPLNQNIDYFVKELEEIHQSLQSEGNSTLFFKLKELVEKFMNKKNLVSFTKQVYLSKLFAYLHILIIPYYHLSNEDYAQVISRSYFSIFKNDIFLILQNLLETNDIISNQTLDSDVLSSEMLYNFIINLEFKPNSYFDNIKIKKMAKKGD